MAQSGWYGTVAQDMLETVQDLAWPNSIQTYSRMRRDPQVAATLNAYILPIRAGNWAIDPAGCSDDVVDFAADAWGLPVLGKKKDLERNGFRRRGVLWKQHVRMAMLTLVFGHSPFAFAGEIAGQPRRWRLTTLAERLPQTISNIQVADNGDLVGIYQYGEDNLIPASGLLWYAHEKEGANWAGTSMLREAYGPWLLKHDMWRVLGISSRRFGMGVPSVEAPAGATQNEIELAARLAESARVGDQSGAGMPNGFKFHLDGLTGSVPDTMGFVKYLDSQIAQGVLASVLNLSESATGNRALGEVLISLLRLSWEAVAEEISIPASQLTARMVDINWGKDEPSPEIVCSGLGRPEATAEAVTQLLSAKALSPDPTLERWARERWDLPEIDPKYLPKPKVDTPPQLPPGQTVPAAPAAGDPAAPPDPRADPASKTPAGAQAGRP